VSEEVATQIAKNCSRQPPHSHLRPPQTGTPASIPIYLIFPETRVIGLHFCCCMSGFIFIQICAVGSKRRIFSAPDCVFGRSRSFRVIQGRWFWYHSKARVQLPISRSLWLWSYLAPFSRYGDLLAKNGLFLLHHFCYPSLIRRRRSLCSLWNFALKLTTRKLDSWGYPTVKTPWS